MNNIILHKPQYAISQITSGFKKCNLESSNKLLGDLKLVTNEYGKYNEFFRTQILDKNENVLGEEIFALENSGKNLFGFDIVVNKELRKIGARLGELLRLSSIIEMLENNIPFLDIMSKGSAVYFHSKYKFEPEIRSFDQLRYALNSIIEHSKDKYEDFAPEAKKLYEIIDKDENILNLMDARKKANELIKKYITKVMNEKADYKDHSFVLGFNMRLNKDSIIENKDFFNKLFENHGIDYKI